MEIKACIFDLDGVIVDTAKYHYLAWKRLAEKLGFDFSEDHNERLKGVSRMRSLEILLDVGKITKTTEEMEYLAAKKNDWYVDYIKELRSDEILPGVQTFLDEIHALGIKTAIGSASKNTPLILERLNLSGYFDAVIDGTKVSKAKPDPEVFIKGAEALNVNPIECIVFEDAQAGIEAAKNGKMYCVGVGKPENLEGYDYLISGFEGLTFDTILKNLKK
jgi:beta-phosphoglucomutase